jgi:hypothetical protein
MAALLPDIQMSSTLTTCRVLHNTSPIVLVDSGGHLFASLAEATTAEPGEIFVLLHKKISGTVFAKVKIAPENSPAPIINPKVDVSVSNGGSEWDTAARLDVLPTISKQLDKTSKQTMHVKRVRFADAGKVMGGLHHFSEDFSDDEFVPDKQPTRQPCLKLWPSLLSRRTRCRWLTCQRCAIPWTVPAALSFPMSSVKR